MPRSTYASVTRLQMPSDTDTVLNELETGIQSPPTPPPTPEETPKRRGRPPGSKNAPKAPTETDLNQVRNAWLGLWLVIKLIARFLGYEEVEGALTNEKAMEDAQALAPIVQRHPTLGRILSWIGAPIVIVRRISEGFKRKGKKESEGKKEPAKQAS